MLNLPKILLNSLKIEKILNLIPDTKKALRFFKNFKNSKNRQILSPIEGLGHFLPFLDLLKTLWECLKMLKLQF